MQKEDFNNRSQTDLNYWVVPGLDHSQYNLNNLLSVVADTFNLAIEDLKSNNRRRELVDARHCYFIIARKKTDRSMVSIGRTLNRDHTTVLHALKKYNKYQLKKTVDELLKII
jgi:chromosomal replication initiator protein